MNKDKINMKMEQEEDINDHYNLNEKEKEEFSTGTSFEENYIKKASEKINELIMSRVRILILNKNNLDIF